MLARYSNSPELHLPIASSGIRRLLLASLYACVATALWCVYLRGYPWLALVLLPAALLCCQRLWAEPLAGIVINWRSGQWSVERAGARVAIRLNRRSICLPAMIYLAWVEVPTGRRRGGWLFADSADPEQQRCLRVRLRLGRSVGGR